MAVESFREHPCDLEIHAERTDDSVIVRLCGELDLAAEETFTEAMDRLRIDAPLVVFDLRQVQFMDSCGLRLLLAERNRLADMGRSLFVYVDADSPVERLLNAVGLNGALELKTSGSVATDRDGQTP